MFKRFIAAAAALMSTAALAQAASAPAGAVVATAAEIGFFAGVVGFFAGWLLTWPALIGLVILGVIFEHNEAHNASAFMLLVAAAVSYFFFSVSLTTVAIGAAGYLIIGVLWSFWRYKRHAQKVVKKNQHESEGVKKHALERLHPSAMLGTITYWVMVWPFSFISSVSADLINLVQTVITKFFRGVYHRIYNSAAESLM
jgi:Ca2+/Na+ antiporter